MKIYLQFTDEQFILLGEQFKLLPPQFDPLQPPLIMSSRREQLTTKKLADNTKPIRAAVINHFFLFISYPL